MFLFCLQVNTSSFKRTFFPSFALHLVVPHPEDLKLCCKLAEVANKYQDKLFFSKASFPLWSMATCYDERENKKKKRFKFLFSHHHR